MNQKISITRLGWLACVVCLGCIGSAILPQSTTAQQAIESKGMSSGDAPGEKGEASISTLPRLVEAPEDADYRTHTPYVWISLDAFADAGVDELATPSRTLSNLMSATPRTLGDPSRCSSYLQLGATPAAHAVQRDTANSYLSNPLGVVSATVTDERGGLFYGKLSRLLYLRINWYTKSARTALPLDPEVIVAYVPEVTVILGDEVVCRRFHGTTDELLAIGTRVLFFPPERLRPDGIVRVAQLDDVLVAVGDDVAGASALVRELDFESADLYTEIESYVQKRMGPYASAR